MLKAPGERILPHVSRNYYAPTLFCLLYFLYLRCLFSPRGLPALACFACLFVLARLARLAGLAGLVGLAGLALLAGLAGVAGVAGRRHSRWS